MKSVSSKQPRANNTRWQQILAFGIRANQAEQPPPAPQQPAPVFVAMP